MVTPAITVIIPTRDRADLFTPVLTAYVEQAVAAGGEIVVVDDGSIDETPRRLERMAGGGAPLRWTSQPPRGPAAARNRALDMAASSLFLFTGDDMFPMQGLLAAHVAAHRSLRRTAVVGHVAWDPAMPTSPLMRAMAPNGPLFNFRKLVGCRRGRYRFFYTAHLSLTTETLAGARFDERFRAPAFEDTELGLRLEEAGTTLLYRRDLCVYHRHPLRARDMVHRLEALRQGRVTLARVHPELAPTPWELMRESLLRAMVRAWVPLEEAFHLEPRVPEHWTM